MDKEREERNEGAGGPVREEGKGGCEASEP